MPAPTPSPTRSHNYRVAVNPNTGEHGYEIGYWPENADEGSDYVVVARCYDQQEAAKLALAANAGTLKPKDEVEAEAEPEEDEEPHRRRRK